MFDIHPELVVAYEKLKEAERNFVTFVKTVQENCPHDIVVQSPSGYSNDNLRVCTRCRLLERGTKWSNRKNTWAKEHYQEAVLGNKKGRLVIQEEIYQSEFVELYLTPSAFRV